MAGIQTSIQITDRVTPVMRSIMSALNSTINTFDNLNDKMGSSVKISGAINDARQQLAGAAEQLNTIGVETEQNTEKQEEYNRSLGKGTASAGNLAKTIMGLAVVQKGISLVKGQLDSAISRMDTMTNFDRTMTSITGSADLAQKSLNTLKEGTKGTAYGLDTAASAVQNFTTRGLDIGNSTKEVLKWGDAVAFYGDGTNESLATVTDAIGKMMSKGKVEMEQLNRITDVGIDAVGIYAKATGQSSASVQDSLSKGKIGAVDFVTTVSKAFEEGTNGVLSVAGEAQKAGTSTWAASLGNAKAAITRGLIKIIDGINQGLARAGLGSLLDGVKTFGEKAEEVLTRVGAVLGVIAEYAGKIAKFFSDNWSVIEPIILGIAAAIGIYAIASGIATAAQWAWNAAMTANPIGIIIALIAILIGAIIALAQWIADTTDCADSALGVIGGGLFWLGALFKNIGLSIANFFIALGQSIWVIIQNAWIFIKNTGLTIGNFFVALGLSVWAIIQNIGIFFKNIGLTIANFFVALGKSIATIVQNIGIAFKNFGYGVANIALGIWSSIKAVCSNIGTAFHNVISNVQGWWYDLLGTAMKVISGICEALNKLPFVDFDYSGITSKATEFAEKSKAAYDSKEKYKSIGDAFNEGASTYQYEDFKSVADAWSDGMSTNEVKWDYKSVGDAWNNGMSTNETDWTYNSVGDAWNNGMSTFDTWKDGWGEEAFAAGVEWGDGLWKDITDKFSSFTQSGSSGDTFGDDLPEITANTGDTAANTAKSAKALSSTSEDLKYLRDIAERDVINRFTTASITIKQNNTNNVSSGADLDGLMNGMVEGLQEAIANTTEGVHF